MQLYTSKTSDTSLTYHIKPEKQKKRKKKEKKETYVLFDVTLFFRKNQDQVFSVFLCLTFVHTVMGQETEVKWGFNDRVQTPCG